MIVIVDSVRIQEKMDISSLMELPSVFVQNGDNKQHTGSWWTEGAGLRPVQHFLLEPRGGCCLSTRSASTSGSGRPDDA